MNVLTINPRFLTLKECEQVSVFASCCRYDADDSIEGDKYECEELSHQPPIIQEWFDQWCGEASAEYNLHPDDNRDRLWQKFCEVVGR
jgi:hypothetical protein